MAQDAKDSFNLFTWARNSFAAGVALVLPFLVTVWVVWTVVTFIDSNVVPLLPARLQPYAELIPGAGVVFAVAALTVVGALVGNLVGRFLLRTSERIIANLPLVRSIYGGSKQIFSQIAAPERQSFKEAVLVEFPKPGSWAIGFVTTEQTRDIAGGVGEDVVAVYVPQAPIPTSGFLIYFRRSDLLAIALPPEEALQRVISLGLIRKDDGEAAALPDAKQS
jgi:uncharacterized membrane protein